MNHKNHEQNSNAMTAAITMDIRAALLNSARPKGLCVDCGGTDVPDGGFDSGELVQLPFMWLSLRVHNNWRDFDQI